MVRAPTFASGHGEFWVWQTCGKVLDKSTNVFHSNFDITLERKNFPEKFSEDMSFGNVQCSFDKFAKKIPSKVRKVSYRFVRKNLKFWFFQKTNFPEEVTQDTCNAVWAITPETFWQNSLKFPSQWKTFGKTNTQFQKNYPFSQGSCGQVKCSLDDDIKVFSPQIQVCCTQNWEEKLRN